MGRGRAARPGRRVPRGNVQRVYRPARQAAVAHITRCDGCLNPRRRLTRTTAGYFCQTGHARQHGKPPSVIGEACCGCNVAGARASPLAGSGQERLTASVAPASTAASARFNLVRTAETSGGSGMRRSGANTRSVIGRAGCRTLIIRSACACAGAKASGGAGARARGTAGRGPPGRGLPRLSHRQRARGSSPAAAGRRRSRMPVMKAVRAPPLAAIASIYPPFRLAPRLRHRVCRTPVVAGACEFAFPPGNDRGTERWRRGVACAGDGLRGGCGVDCWRRGAGQLCDFTLAAGGMRRGAGAVAAGGAAIAGAGGGGAARGAPAPGGSRCAGSGWRR